MSPWPRKPSAETQSRGNKNMTKIHSQNSNAAPAKEAVTKIWPQFPQTGYGQPGPAAHTCNPGTPDAETGGSWIQDQCIKLFCVALTKHHDQAWLMEEFILAYRSRVVPLWWGRHGHRSRTLEAHIFYPELEAERMGWEQDKAVYSQSPPLLAQSSSKPAALKLPQTVPPSGPHVQMSLWDTFLVQTTTARLDYIESLCPHLNPTPKAIDHL